jgi:hypothetical protein
MIWPVGADIEEGRYLPADRHSRLPVHSIKQNITARRINRRP